MLDFITFVLISMHFINMKRTHKYVQASERVYCKCNRNQSAKQTAITREKVSILLISASFLVNVLLFYFFQLILVLADIYHENSLQYLQMN